MRIAAWNVAARLLLEAGPVLRGAQREQELGAHVVVDRARQLARPQRRPVVLGRLLPREHPVRAARGGQREVDRAIGPLDRRRLGEVVGEHRQVRVEVAAAQAHERLADAAVQARPPQLGDAVVEGRAHQRVGERVAADVARLAQHARLDALLQRLHQLVPGLGDDARQHVVVELAPDHRGHEQHRAGGFAQAAAAAAR